MSRINNFITFALFLLILTFNSSASEQVSKTDSLNLLLKKAQHDSTRIALYIELGEEHLYSAPDSAIILFKKAIEYANSILNSRISDEERIDTKNRIAKSNEKIGEALKLKGDINSAFDYYNKSLSLYTKTDNKKGVATLLVNIGVTYRMRGDNEKALEYYLKGKSIHKSTKNEQGVARTYSNIGALYYHQGDINNALEYYYKGLSIQESIGDEHGAARMHNSIGVAHYRLGNLEKTTAYYQKSLAILQRVGRPNEIATLQNNIANLFEKQGNIPKAIKYYNMGVATQETIGDKRGMATSLNNIGNVYRTLGNIPKTLEFFTKSLQIREETEDKLGMAIVLTNIGNVYRSQDELDYALENYLKSLEICREINSKRGIAVALNSIGVAYRHKADKAKLANNSILADSLYSLAISSYMEGLTVSKEIGDSRRIANLYNNLGFMYHMMSKENDGNVKSDSLRNIALKNYQQSLSISERIDNKQGKAYTLANIGTIQLEKNNIRDALNLGNKAYTYSKKLGYPQNIQRSAKLLKEVHEKLGNFEKAYNFFKEEITMRDSIINETNLRETIRQQAYFEFTKKATIDSLNHAAKIEIKELELASMKENKRKQQIVSFSLVVGFVLVLAFSFIVYRMLLKKNEANKLLVLQKEMIKTQNSELSQANEEISCQRDEIEVQRDTVIKQKERIEKQNQQITDSINYAQRIQKAILPKTSVLFEKKQFSNLSDGFVIYKPKDIVSGDFYWIKQSDQQTIIALADCTGHGVPGAFMSMLGVSLLKEVVNRSESPTANKILEELRNSIKNTLNQTGEKFEARDGMSMALLIINNMDRSMQFASSYIPLYLYRNGDLHIYKGDRNPIGIAYKEKDSFKNHTIQLESKDALYLFTDGYIDQFGHETKEKYKAHRLRKVLQDIHYLPMNEQKKKLDSVFGNWKGNHEQIDDVTVLGLRI